jgi:hypothetical protein
MISYLITSVILIGVAMTLHFCLTRRRGNR